MALILRLWHFLGGMEENHGDLNHSNRSPGLDLNQGCHELEVGVQPTELWCSACVVYELITGWAKTTACFHRHGKFNWDSCLKQISVCRDIQEKMIWYNSMQSSESRQTFWTNILPTSHDWKVSQFTTFFVYSWALKVVTCSFDTPFHFHCYIAEDTNLLNNGC
jgi:hypothetical protein